MPPDPITSLADPRLAPYRNLKDRDLSREGGRFIAEGELVVRRLIASPLTCESVLCIDRKAESLADVVPPAADLLVATPQIVNAIVGFKFHSGVMAVGHRPPSPSLESLFPPDPIGDSQSAIGNQITLLICPAIEKADNLGSLVRIAAAFGADALLLGPRCADPYYRQAVRVSMGAVFSLPVLRSHDLLHDLARLKAEFQVDLVASVLDPAAAPLESAARAPRTALLLGNEGHGLAPEEVAACQQTLTIPMQRNIDSLNVSVAAGIFLHHFTRVAPTAR